MRGRCSLKSSYPSEFFKPLVLLPVRARTCVCCSSNGIRLGLASGTRSADKTYESFMEPNPRCQRNSSNSAPLPVVGRNVPLQKSGMLVRKGSKEVL